MENPNLLPDSSQIYNKKNDENKNRKFAKLRQIFPKCVNKWVDDESFIEYCKLGKLSIKLNWLNWFSSQFPNSKTQ